jgi:TIR domain
MTQQIFLSYSREDAAFVRWLTEQLEARQLSVWVDRDDIAPSAKWRAEIDHGIVRCGACRSTSDDARFTMATFDDASIETIDASAEARSFDLDVERWVALACDAAGRGPRAHTD